MKYLIIAALLLISCKKEPQTISMLFRGDMNFCKGYKPTQSEVTIYYYEKRKNKGTIIVKSENINDNFSGYLTTPEKGEQFRFTDDNFGLGIIKDNKLTLTYSTPICGYSFKGEKR